MYKVKPTTIYLLPCSIFYPNNIIWYVYLNGNGNGNEWNSNIVLVVVFKFINNIVVIVGITVEDGLNLEEMGPI